MQSQPDIDTMNIFFRGNMMKIDDRLRCFVIYVFVYFTKKNKRESLPHLNIKTIQDRLKTVCAIINYYLYEVLCSCRSLYEHNSSQHNTDLLLR